MLLLNNAFFMFQLRLLPANAIRVVVGADTGFGEANCDLDEIHIDATGRLDCTRAMELAA